jgi:hypothetical protein
MLLLYGFVITPTQWWHQHDSIFTSSSITISKEKSVPAWATERGTHCKICSHHFSCHKNEAVIILPKVQEKLTLTACDSTCRISLPVLGNPAERGPPFIG